MSIDADGFRRIAGSFPTGVTIVTAAEADGTPRGLTTNATCSVSLDPPMLLVCIDKGSTTLPVLRERGAFVVNYMAAGREGLARRFAQKRDDKFEGVAWEPSASAAAAPILRDDAVAWAECLLSGVVEAGDHWICIGSVVGGVAGGGAPLLYYGRSYSTLDLGASEG